MFTKQELKRIEKLLSEGLSPVRIAEEFGLTHSGLRYRLRESGVKVEVTRRLTVLRPGEVSLETVEAA